MTDDDLVIRHVRLCECGMPAEHDGICRPSRLAAATRVDTAWEAENADRRAEKHAKREREFDAKRRERRATLNNTLALHHSAIERAAGLSTVPAGQTQRSRSGGASSSIPPSQQLLDEDPRWAEHWRVIESRLLRVHELIDEAAGHGTVKGSATLIREEKQRRVLDDGRGLSPLGVVEMLGHYLAGSPETVRRDRKEEGVCVRDGMAPKAECKCVVCQHARKPRANCDCGVCRHEAGWNMPISTPFARVPAKLRQERKAAGVCLRDGQAPRSGCACIVCREHWPPE